MNRLTLFSAMARHLREHCDLRTGRKKSGRPKAKVGVFTYAGDDFEVKAVNPSLDYDYYLMVYNPVRRIVGEYDHMTETGLKTEINGKIYRRTLSEFEYHTYCNMWYDQYNNTVRAYVPVLGTRSYDLLNPNFLDEMVPYVNEAILRRSTTPREGLLIDEDGKQIITRKQRKQRKREKR